MAAYIETALDQIIPETSTLWRRRDFERRKIERKENPRTDSPPHTDPVDELYAADIPLADPKMEITVTEEVIVNRSCPQPDHPIIIRPQVGAPTELEEPDNPDYIDYIQNIAVRDAAYRQWEASQKEPLVEVPIRLTKQYFAIIQEMEEYSEKRAAKALSGIDGHTMQEKEDGIKRYEAFFGGLRSLGEREKYQGIPPWDLEISDSARKRIAKESKSKASVSSRRTLSPAAALRLQNSGSGKVMEEKERVIWRFEDVSWVKQRTTRPRKRSYAGTLDTRVAFESGVERYGPYGIGGGIEGVGGVKKVIERGIDGELRVGPTPRPKFAPRRELVV
jgi:hypothetical protein